MSFAREPIAIVGMSCLFPEAASLEEYWSNIKLGTNAVKPIPVTHWAPEDYYSENPKKIDHTYAKTGAFLSNFAFDPLKYGMTPSSLEATDSTQLLGMVVAEKALADAGITKDSSIDRDRMSCILGVTGTLELVVPLGARLGHPHWRKSLKRAGIEEELSEAIIKDVGDAFVGWQEASFPGLLGNVVAGRIANRLNLGGSNAVVDAACASSLAALRTAVMELQSGRSDVAVTGGMDTFNDIFMYMCFSKTPALSPTGDARPFDAEGDGTILGEGLGAVVLKRLGDAEQAGDKIYGVIRGLGSSSDGKGKAIYAPSAAGQQKALRRAYQDADITPRDIGLIECHGTGTKVGDGIELEALKKVYKEHQSDDDKWVTLGSVKSQIGHTKAAAGIAGLIKAVLALYHKTLPPTLKIKTPHPVLENSPFIIRNKATPWLSSGKPRYAAVSAFGFGGSNYHCVLEEYNDKKTLRDQVAGEYWLILAAPGKADMDQKLESLQKRLKLTPDPAILREMRPSLGDEDNHWRLVLRASTITQLVELIADGRQALHNDGLADFAKKHRGHFSSQTKKPKLAVVFAGQGSQYPNMLASYAVASPHALDSLEKTNEILGGKLFAKLYPGQAFDNTDRELQAQNLARTSIAQPAIGALSAAIWQDLVSFGVKADVFAGHSFGELTALFAAGALSHDDFLKIAACRGDLMNNAAANLGGMLALNASLSEVEKGLVEQDSALVVANHNSPTQTVVSGDDEEIKAFFAYAQKKSWRPVVLNVGAAFHSPRMEKLSGPFNDFLKALNFTKSNAAIYANKTAEAYENSPAAYKQGLCEQLAARVRFVEMIKNIAEQGVDTFLEIGPSSILSRMIQGILGESGPSVISFDKDKKSNTGLEECLTQLFVAGVDVDWSRFQADWQATYEPRPKFAIDINGANYRSPQAPSKLEAEAAEIRKRSKISMGTVVEDKPSSYNQPLTTTKRQDSVSNQVEINKNKLSKDQLTMSTSKPRLPSSIIEKNLVFMQKMQEQNAKLHEQFLKNQAENQRMLFDLLGSVGDFSQNVDPVEEHVAVEQNFSINRVDPVQDVTKEQGEPVASHQVASNSGERFSQPSRFKERPHTESAESLEEDKKTSSAETQKEGQAVGQPKYDDGPAAAKVVLGVIAQATGYPAETLSLDMELEEDLGIDSIKRVEIFSMLQEEMPSLKEMSPEELSSLSSVAEIIVAASSQNKQLASTTVLAPESGATKAEVQDRPSDSSKIVEYVKDVIAEKTGYPTASLSEDLSLEDDLGIDSIKRVEIISNLQEKYQTLSGMDAEELSAVVTIADLVSVISEQQNPQPFQESSLAEAQVQSASQGTSSAVLESAHDKETQANITIKTVVAEKTGYPVASLEDDMSLEEDLGIDSIKKVEILSDLGEKFPILSSASQEELSHLQSIRELEDFINDRGASAQDANVNEVAQTEKAIAEISPEDVTDESIRPVKIACQKIELVEVEAEEQSHLSLSQDGEVWVTDDGSSFARNIVMQMKERGFNSQLISTAFVDRLVIPEKLSALIMIGPLKLENHPARFLLNSFKLIKRATPALRREAKGDRLLVTLSRNEGQLGFSPLTQTAQVFSGALAGFTKSLRHEWSDVKSLHVDVSREFGSSAEVASQAVDAMLSYDNPEIAVSEKGVFKPVLTNLQVAMDDYQNSLNHDEVVIVTGGGRGVTAALTKTLAKGRVKIAVWGRTKLEDLPDFVTKNSSLNDLKKLVHEAGLATNPKDINALALRYHRLNELKMTLEQARQNGAEVRYMSVDVAKESAVRSAIREITNEWGEVHTLIHGAGVLADNEFEKISDADFSAVIDTKLRALAVFEKYTANSLRNVILFSSSTARFGRKGQAAYAVANEALNKYVHYFNSQYENINAVAINWGPWAGGMVDSGLQKLFASEGLGLIPLDAGCRIALSQLDRAAASEFVVLSQLENVSHEQIQSLAGTISLNSHPVLHSHILNRKAVVPAVLLLELMLSGLKNELKKEKTGLQVVNFKVLKGITLKELEEVAYTVRYEERSSSVVGDGDQQSYEVSLFARHAGGEAARPSAKCQVILLAQEQLLSSRSAKSLPVVEDKWEHPNLDELYDTSLFHGDDLQGLSQLRRFGPDGVVGTSLSAPHAKQWVTDDSIEAWTLDPLAIDVGFQLAVLWSEKKLGAKSLPIGFKQLEVFQEFPRAGCEVRLKINAVRGQSFTADIAFVLEDEIIAYMTAYEAITDQSLDQSFARNSLESTQSS